MTIYNRVVSRVPTKQAVLALTFNIANGRKVPLSVLKLLKTEGITSTTFFVTGTWARSNPDIARKITNMGYEIASHGYLHENYSERSNAWIERDVTRAQRAIQSACGIKPMIIRTPSGDMNLRVIKKLLNMNQQIIHWGTDSLDWKIRNPSQIVSKVLKKAKSGDIILLHACDTWHQSLDALPSIIKGLRQKGFRFLSVSELRKYEE